MINFTFFCQKKS